MKLVIFVVLGSLLILAGLIYGLPYLTQEGSSGRPGKIEISPLEYDFGTVSMGDSHVKYTYEISNVGQGDLKIDSIWTSCMCTTARLRVGDKESPEFGMHTNSMLWSQKIPPGEKGYLDVTFDQALHGEEGIGQIVRAIYISNNDPQTPKTQVMLFGTVVK
ncbi:MAG: DUF1573 domain-containing protein [Candidatus Nealsonbacteria bacterium]|nr:DUF1573 domain-containing protein [Candidatus Nealsonbacteria bacterium]